jgi:hypothetical protein
MMPEKSRALKGVEVASLELILDDLMQVVPRANFDLSDEANRVKLRNWLRQMGSRIVYQNSCAINDAMRRTVDEVGALFVDPDHYETKRKLREEARKRKEQAAVSGRKVVAFGKPMRVK